VVVAPLIPDSIQNQRRIDSKTAKRPKMKTNRFVTTELGMQVGVSLTAKSAFTSVPYILGVSVGNTTRYSPCGGGEAKSLRAITPYETL